jgi:hypothetical protein
MEEQNPLDKKKRCPKGQFRNKEGVCVEKPKTDDEVDKLKEPKVKEPKVKEPKVKEPKVKEPKVKEPKVKEPKAKEPKVKEPKAKDPKAKTTKRKNASPNKTLKKLTKVQAAKILSERRTCIQAFRDKL